MITLIDLHWMGDYYRWCVAAYDAQGNMVEEFEPSYHDLKAEAMEEGLKSAKYYNCRMVSHTATGKQREVYAP